MCAELAKPEWWNDEELKALSAGVVRAVPDDAAANEMRAMVLSGMTDATLGGGASLGGGAQGGGHALRAGCGAALCSCCESRDRRGRGGLPQPGRGHGSSRILFRISDSTLLNIQYILSLSSEYVDAPTCSIVN